MLDGLLQNNCLLIGSLCIGAVCTRKYIRNKTKKAVHDEAARYGNSWVSWFGE
jgi:hypothetical protein